LNTYASCVLRGEQSVTCYGNNISMTFYVVLQKEYFYDVP
jgi:hypothetical protein